MKKRIATMLLAAATAWSPLAAPAQEAGAAAAAPTAETPKIFLDKNPKIVAYQLKRLTNPQLIGLERSTTDKKYAPVYLAILGRKGLEKKYREEAPAALVTINKSTPVTELLKGIASVDKTDTGTPRELSGLLLARPAAELTAQRSELETLAKDAQAGTARSAALAALAVIDAKPDTATQIATEGDATAALLGAIPLIPDAKLRAQFYPQVKPLLAEAPDEATQVAAIEAAGYVPGHEKEIFAALGEVIQKSEGARAAAIRSIDRIPANKWDPAAAESLAKAVVKLVEAVPADQRTTPAAIATIQFGNDLAGGLPAAQGAPIRKALRELGVRIVLIKTLPEQMSYDLRYFVAEAAKPVEIVLENPDTMPHNIVFTSPGAMQEVALEGAAMPQLADPAVKPYVPNNPKVLSASRAAEAGDSTKLSFTAPKEPGEYPYVCTFPGHWVRMYGVMVVVNDIEKYDQNPVAPKDPVLNKPFESQKTDPSQVQAAHEHAH